MSNMRIKLRWIEGRNKTFHSAWVRKLWMLSFRSQEFFIYMYQHKALQGLIIHWNVWVQYICSLQYPAASKPGNGKLHNFTCTCTRTTTPRTALASPQLCKHSLHSHVIGPIHIQWISNALRMYPRNIHIIWQHNQAKISVLARLVIIR